MSVFKPRLYLENGEDVGPFAAAVPDWSIGDELCNQDNEVRTIDIAPDLGGGEFTGAFVVTPTVLCE